jgi:hypothetical protein
VDHPTHQDILDKLHLHDLRLVRVEERQSAMAGEQADQSRRLDTLSARIERLGDLIAGLSAQQRLILAFLAVGLPVIAGLELWDRLAQ